MSKDCNDTDKTLTTTIDLFRHGDCEGGKIFRGSTNSLLSSAGFEQMSHSIGDNPPKWDAIISSPLRRCADFAEMLSIQYQVPFEINSHFSEIDFGDWEGELVDRIYESQAQAVENFWVNPIDHPAPNAETMEVFQKRINSAWLNSLEKYQGKHLLLISHGGVIRMILAHILGMPMRPLSRLYIPHASISRIQVFQQSGKEDWPQLMFMNNVYP